MLSHDYSFDDQQDHITVVGVGRTGMAAVDNLVHLSINGLDTISLSTDPTDLASSLATHKIAFAADDSEPHATFMKSLAPGEPVFIVADLNDTDSYELVLRATQYSEEADHTCLVIVAKTTDVAVDLQPIEANSHGLMVLLPDERTVTSQQLTSAVKALATISLTYDGTINVDFADIKHIMRGSGRAAIAECDAKGEHRAAEVIEKMINVVDTFSIDWQQVQRVLMLATYSSEHALRLREQVTLSKGIVNKIDSEPNQFKMGVAEREGLGENLKLITLLWMPVSID